MTFLKIERKFFFFFCKYRKDMVWTMGIIKRYQIKKFMRVLYISNINILNEELS